jgi:predicted flap endonuclease-1-like 5' DNA nuclease
MSYLLQALFGWWIAALVLGLLFGLFVTGAKRPAAWTIWSVLVASLYVLGAVAATLKGLPDRYGFWLETALLALTFYFVGYAVGGVSRRLFGRSKASTAAASPEMATVLAPDLAPDVAPNFAADSLASQGVALDAAASKTPPPEKLSLEPAGEKDDLLRIRGIDENAAQDLRELGVESFAQLAALTPEQERLFADKRPDCGPAARQFWIAQAQLIDGGVDPDLAPDDALAPLDEGGALSLRAALPEVITPHVNDALYAGIRPLSLRQPPLGEMDDLEKIAGIDPATAERLNALGIWTYAQIACWSDQHVRWIGSYLAFPGRIERDSWVGQAQALVD